MLDKCAFSVLGAVPYSTIDGIVGFSWAVRLPSSLLAALLRLPSTRLQGYIFRLRPSGHAFSPSKHHNHNHKREGHMKMRLMKAAKAGGRA